jgi:hypothetical protein
MIKAKVAKEFTKMSTEGYHIVADTPIFRFLCNVIDTNIQISCSNGKSEVLISREEIVNRYPYLIEIDAEDWQAYFHSLTTHYVNIGYKVSYNYNTSYSSDEKVLTISNMELTLKW